MLDSALQRDNNPTHKTTPIEGKKIVETPWWIPQNYYQSGGPDEKILRRVKDQLLEVPGSGKGNQTGGRAQKLIQLR